MTTATVHVVAGDRAVELRGQAGHVEWNLSRNAPRAMSLVLLSRGQTVSLISATTTATQTVATPNSSDRAHSSDHVQEPMPWKGIASMCRMDGREETDDVEPLFVDLDRHERRRHAHGFWSGVAGLLQLRPPRRRSHTLEESLERAFADVAIAVRDLDRQPHPIRGGKNSNLFVEAGGDVYISHHDKRHQRP